MLVCVFTFTGEHFFGPQLLESYTRRMELNFDTPNPAHATIKKLLSDPVDVLLRPKGEWKRPDDLLGALAEEIATNQGDLADALTRGAAPAIKEVGWSGSTSTATPRATPPSKRWRTRSRTARTSRTRRAGLQQSRESLQALGSGGDSVGRRSREPFVGVGSTLLYSSILGSRPGSDLFRACWVSCPKERVFVCPSRSPPMRFTPRSSALHTAMPEPCTPPAKLVQRWLTTGRRGARCSTRSSRTPTTTPTPASSPPPPPARARHGTRRRRLRASRSSSRRRCRSSQFSARCST